MSFADICPTLQLPSTFLESIAQVPGIDLQSLEQLHNSGEQVTSIRINPLKCSNGNALFQEADRVPWCATGYYLQERPSFTFDPLFHAGAYYVQEASSMFLWQVLKTIKPNPGEEVLLDSCAAPGGKSTLLASYFPQGLIIANEVIKPRASVLVENITKWGSGNVVVTNNDPADFSKLPSMFDGVVVDAPCSGSGLFRKDPAAIQEWSVQNVQLCCQRQQRIIAGLWNSLKPGGYMVYSTCSYSMEEDEAISDWLLSNYDAQSIRIPLNNDWGIVETTSTKHQAFGYRFFPDKVRGEGFFIAVFQKAGNENLFQKPLPLRKSISATELSIVEPWVVSAPFFTFVKQGERMLALPAKHSQAIFKLIDTLYLRLAGTFVGEIKGKDFIPSHDLAISTIANTNIPAVDVDKATALDYLKKKEILVDNFRKGWTLIRYLGVNLGWIKVLQNRVNNYYPIEWRILKD